MSMRAEASIAQVGKQLESTADRIQAISRYFAQIREARELLLQASAGLNAIVAAPKFLTEHMNDVVWEAWQRTRLAADHADDAVVLLNCPLEEKCIVAAPSEHVYVPRSEGTEQDVPSANGRMASYS